MGFNKFFLIFLNIGLIVLCFSGETCFAGEADSGLHTDIETQRLYRSAYFLGRGDTGIANADDQEAIFYNPAGLALGKGVYKRTVLGSPHLEISSDTKDLVRQISQEGQTGSDVLKEHVGKPQHLGIYNFSGIVFRRVAIGGLISNQTNILVYKDEDKGGLESVDAETVANQAFTFSIAESFFDDHLLLGTTGKFVNRGVGTLSLNVLDADQLDELDEGSFLGYGNGGGADVGMMFIGGTKLVPFYLGLTVENAGDTKMKPENESTVLDDLKQTVNVGLAVEPGTRFSKFKLFLDYRDITSTVEENPYKKSHVGVEISIKSLIGFTTGLNQGYPCGGFYVDLHFLRLDIGAYTQEVGKFAGARPDPRYYLRLLVGF